MRTETDWEPAKPGVITEDYRESLLLIRQAARVENSEDVTLREFTVLEHPAADTDEEIIAETDEAVERTEEDDA